MRSIKYSVVVPVYNRPGELHELLTSLTIQTCKDFEVIVVEDGSTITSQRVVEDFSGQLTIQYAVKPNTGPGPSRNFGFALAKGEYFVVFDSDCILPPTYFDAVNLSLQQHQWDAWGGPDRGHPTFTNVQRAMAYTMSSVLTTGGIRGADKQIGRFQPRSFNMGISRKVWETTHGFAFDRMAEDIEFSIRMFKNGFKVGLVPDAFVYHKRRSTFQQFFQQVSNFGRGRVRVGKTHRGEVKLVHWFPLLFSVGLVFVPVLAFISSGLFILALSIYVVYLVAIFLDAWYLTRSLGVAFLSIPSVLIQMIGYGSGFGREVMFRQAKGQEHP
jgi:glycosyltransferase involved in cell wall biosynthesis